MDLEDETRLWYKFEASNRNDDRSNVGLRHHPGRRGDSRRTSSGSRSFRGRARGRWFQNRHRISENIDIKKTVGHAVPIREPGVRGGGALPSL